MKEKESFILYTQYLENIALLSMEQRGILFTAILNYTADLPIPEIEDNAVKIAFSFIRSQIDRDTEKYNQIRAKRSEAGKKGGRPRKSAGEQEEFPALRKFPNKFHNFSQRDTDYDEVVRQINGF